MQRHGLLRASLYLKTTAPNGACSARLQLHNDPTAMLETTVRQPSKTTYQVVSKAACQSTQ
eukprot:1202503-Alexandrium_andersonii.AAC.1